MDTKEVIPADAKEWNEDAELMTWLQVIGDGVFWHIFLKQQIIQEKYNEDTNIDGRQHIR